jgi:hypothetical protein
MIELKHDSLVFTFPEVHSHARLTIDFQRTLRIPDDGKDYPLPPGLGNFKLRHVDDFSKTVPAEWIDHGGVMLPMYQSEALWLRFSSEYISDHGTAYPFAIKVATGKINAVTGKDWTDWLQRDPQDYMISTEQPWLDGYCVEKGIIRQFVAMPLGTGYSAEEQITGKADHGGIQIIVYPMKRKIFKKRFPKVKRVTGNLKYDPAIPSPYQLNEPMPCFDMGLAPGGRMKQEIYEDPFDLDDWEMDQRSRCFVHIANSLVWRKITGDSPPTVPFNAEEYTRRGLPWFDYYSDNSAPLKGSEILKGLKSVVQLGKDKQDNPLPENESVTPGKIIELRKGLKKNEVREGTF